MLDLMDFDSENKKSSTSSIKIVNPVDDTITMITVLK